MKAKRSSLATVTKRATLLRVLDALILRFVEETIRKRDRGLRRQPKRQSQLETTIQPRLHSVIKVAARLTSASQGLQSRSSIRPRMLTERNPRIYSSTSLAELLS